MANFTFGAQTKGFSTSHVELRDVNGIGWNTSLMRDLDSSTDSGVWAIISDAARLRSLGALGFVVKWEPIRGQVHWTAYNARGDQFQNPAIKVSPDRTVASDLNNRFATRKAAVAIVQSTAAANAMAL